jgi:hypothetical protein
MSTNREWYRNHDKNIVKEKLRELLVRAKGSKMKGYGTVRKPGWWNIWQVFDLTT